ncbi:Response regulator receiver domain-containing protein [Desulfatibacillum alkenivorans DSM 16219]|jgi:DNA-binding NtrC family response regulator|uniref:Response regulator receiver domain-containing protein n=1 Tax=Desulfatibacillum alkenivorans DSM 16219 TaxID=1121393 RepID=A0A1M6XJF8_9BACT|nr:response regulator [Desulfatibacillum alkenivorans]SHL06097.1 Response regulator receiver domain-containing protein [Desulfatibacillum alkenivorans DSM 16219]
MNENRPEKSPLQVLLVDDEQGYLHVLEKRMERRGIKVTTAATGTDAVGILRGTDFDAAVVDLKMEDMDGIEVLNIFKKMVPEMPVIILTGHGSEKAARQGMAQGAFDYLTKPCDLEDLLEKIFQACQSQGKDCAQRAVSAPGKDES